MRRLDQTCFDCSHHNRVESTSKHVIAVAVCHAITVDVREELDPQCWSHISQRWSLVILSWPPYPVVCGWIGRFDLSKIIFQTTQNTVLCWTWPIWVDKIQIERQHVIREAGESVWWWDTRRKWSGFDAWLDFQVKRRKSWSMSNSAKHQIQTCSLLDRGKARRTDSMKSVDSKQKRSENQCLC